MVEPTTVLTFPELDASKMKDNAAQAAQLLRSLGNENRLMILCALASGERSVGELNRDAEISQSSLSQHLGVLRKEGLVETRRVSQTIYYSLADSPAIRVVETLHDIFCSTTSD